MRRRSVTGRAVSAEDLAKFVADLGETGGISGQVLHVDSRIT
jgi:hypothetical protein